MSVFLLSPHICVCMVTYRYSYFFLNHLRVIYIHHGPLSLNTSVYMQSLGVPKTAFILTPIISSGVPKITLSLNNSLEELSESTESSYTHGYTLLNEKERAKGRGTWAESRGFPSPASSPLSQRSRRPQGLYPAVTGHGTHGV